jgi:flagellar M-ring protein FliF
MPAQITGLLGRLQKTIHDFSIAQRTLALIGIAGLVLGGLALSSWMTRPTLAPLFANLSAADASAIVDHLTSAGVQYELTDGGSTIMVPANRLYSMRLEVAAAGLPTASEGGYSLLDDMGMTSSDFQQQVTYQRALEGELARTIGAIEGVEAATVRLALPEESVFVSETANPTASVFIRTTPGTSMDTSKVESIVHLVSAGIEGMAPTDVAVIDAEGHVLSAVGGGATGSGLQDGRTGEYEARLTQNIQAMLDRLVGLGNAVVTVTADLDYDQTVRTTETHTTDEDLPPVSSATSVEEYTGTADGTGGVLGPDNIAVPDVTTDGAGEYRKETATVNNPVDTVVEQLTTAPGTIRRQSVSVVVSEGAAADLDLADLETAVAAAAGVDTERGDVVSVTRMAFDTSSAEAAEEALAFADEQATAERSAELIKTGGIGIAVLLAFVLAVVTGMRRSKRARREALDVGSLELIEMRKAEVIEAAAESRVLTAAPHADDGSAGRRDDIMALAAEQPAEVAEVLRGWLVGGRR